MSYFVVGAMIVSAIFGAVGARNQAKANHAIAQNNMAIADMQAEDSLKRGEQQAQEAQRKARAIASAQRAAYSARGLDISEGTPADVIEQTDFFGQADAATARTNARKEAWAYRARGRGYGIEASANNPSNAFGMSLLSSAPAVASRWYGRQGG